MARNWCRRCFTMRAAFRRVWLTLRRAICGGTSHPQEHSKSSRSSRELALADLARRQATQATFAKAWHRSGQAQGTGLSTRGVNLQFVIPLRKPIVLVAAEL